MKRSDHDPQPESVRSLSVSQQIGMRKKYDGSFHRKGSPGQTLMVRERILSELPKSKQASKHAKLRRAIVPIPGGDREKERGWTNESITAEKLSDDPAPNGCCCYSEVSEWLLQPFATNDFVCM